MTYLPALALLAAGLTCTAGGILGQSRMWWDSPLLLIVGAFLLIAGTALLARKQGRRVYRDTRQCGQRPARARTGWPRGTPARNHDAKCRIKFTPKLRLPGRSAQAGGVLIGGEPDEPAVLDDCYVFSGHCDGRTWFWRPGSISGDAYAGAIFLISGPVSGHVNGHPLHRRPTGSKGPLKLQNEQFDTFLEVSFARV